MEAATIAQAGAIGAVTVSTNMAGRGTDILLGGNCAADRERVIALGGLYVIGTTRHEARRIDNQLRGRAGRQGDPRSSRFFLSLDDDLIVRFGIHEEPDAVPDLDSIQRVIEGQNLEIREMLWKYESVLEHHRREVSQLRRELLFSADAAVRRRKLLILDDCWADYLANIAERREGVQWLSLGGRDPLFEFLKSAREIYDDFQATLREELDTDESVRENLERGATWTYLTTDQPFGTMSERVTKGLRRKIR